MIRQSTLVLLGRASAGVLSLFASVLLARSISVHEYGVFGSVLSLCTFLALLADFGTSASISKERALHHDVEVDAIRSLNSMTSILMAVLATAGLLLCRNRLELPVGLVLIGIGSALEKNTETLSRLFLADDRPLGYLANSLLRRLTVCVIMVAVVGEHLDHALAWYSFAFTLGGCFGQIHCRLGIGRGNAERSESTLLKRLRCATRISVPFFIGNVSAGVKDLDVFVVGLASSSYEAGSYSAAARLYQPLQLVPTSIASIALPRSTRLEESRCRRMVLRLGTVAVVSLPLMLLLGVAVADRAVVLILGDGYARAGGMFTIMLLGSPAFFVSSPIGAILQAKGYERSVARVGVSTAVLMIVALVVFATAFGGTGAASAVAACLWVKVAVLVFIARRALDGEGQDRGNGSSVG